ncbi:MAG: hypothetical protein LBM13_05495 [Candidatus Ancillula sp.]|jgi:hypothetical protein|nr:hypothetical protein [Candidatus Ancillula sp.]
MPNNPAVRKVRPTVRVKVNRPQPVRQNRPTRTISVVAIQGNKRLNNVRQQVRVESPTQLKVEDSQRKSIMAGKVWLALNVMVILLVFGASLFLNTMSNKIMVDSSELNESSQQIKEDIQELVTQDSAQTVIVPQKIAKFKMFTPNKYITLDVVKKKTTKDTNSTEDAAKDYEKHKLN